VVVTGLSRTQLEAARARMANVFLIALAASLALIGVGSAVLAGRAVAPVRRLTLAAERITAEALHERIPRDRGPTEFARLVEVFNDMLDRLGLSFDQARRFSHDAAHELNTPLTVLMGQIDQALHDAPAGSPEQQRWAVLAEEVQRLRDIVRKLLVLARADRGALQPDTQWVDLARIARDCAEDAAAASPLLDISVNGETELPMDGDPSLLRQLVFNLISNATKYNRPGGFVRVRIVRERRDDQPRAVIEVTNAGHAIPLENAARVFDRFFRGDPARNRAVEGLGLGLSLAREFARAHGGDLTLASNSGDNITFRLELPVREE
jgi:signal transduction histidine kinase